LNLDIIDLDWQVDISHARTVVGNEVILAGNINPVLVQDKTRDEVFSLCRNLAEKHKNERYILSAGCEITVLTPPENLRAMDEARFNPASQPSPL
jgi:uroporphyrinogen decarboxylase